MGTQAYGAGARAAQSPEARRTEVPAGESAQMRISRGLPEPVALPALGRSAAGEPERSN